MADITADAGIDDVSSEIQATLTKNAAISQATHGTAAAGASGASTIETDDWRSQPLRYFETDDSGAVKLRADGSPIRKRGLKSPAREGEPAAGGGTCSAGPEQPAETVGASFVAVQPVPGTAAPDATQSEPGTAPMGEAAGRVVANAALNVATGIGGPAAAPTADERKDLTDAVSKAIGPTQVSPWTTVAILALAYLARVWIEKRRSKGTTPQAAQAQSDDPVIDGQPQAVRGRWAV